MLNDVRGSIGAFADETHNAARELNFAAKVNDMIRGLREGLVTMRESGQRVFIVPPELGFGMDGVPGKVPPGATLFYEVELVSIRPSTQP